MAFSMFATPQPQQSQQLFQPQAQPQAQSQPQPFQTSSSFLSQPLQNFQQQQQYQQQQLQQQQQQQQQQQHQLFLFTNDKAPASYSTKWSDLHPDSQKVLLQIEERILEYRDESQRLEQCNRLYDSSVSNDGFEQDASHIVQELGGINSAMEQQRATLQQLMNVVKDMLRNTEVAVRSFMMLRPRFLHPNGGSASNPAALSEAPARSLQPGPSGQQAAMSTVPVFDFYNGLPRKPSPFLQHTVFRFEKYLSECHQWIEELEQLLILDSERRSLNSGMTSLQSLSKVMSNVHDFFVHVAAKVENIRQYIESMKTSYLTDQRRRGNGNNPFLEADRREIARQEAAAKRAHLNMHLSLNSQPSTQVAGLFSSSGSLGVTSTPQIPTTIAPAASGSGLSLFSTPAPPASSMTQSSLFATPAASGTGSTLFGSSVATPQTSLFGTSSPSFLTSTPFGSSSPLITSSASPGSSLFSTPVASGVAQGSGASFGATSKSSKPKSRTARRY